MPPVTHTDARGRTVRLEHPPRRIVSLVPSLTELLADLGLADAVVGVTRFCERPDDWRDAKTIVGGTKQVKLDVVTDLAPDLVIANREENTQADVEALDAVCPVVVTDVRTVPDAVDAIEAIGALTGTSDVATSIATRITERFDALDDALSDADSIRAVYLIWREPFMTVGGDTFIHAVMTRGGFVNPFADDARYPEVTVETIADATPDVVLCSSEPFPFHQKDAFTADLRQALPDVPVEIVDGQMFSWYGSRLLHTPDHLTSLHRRLRANTQTPR